MINRILFKLRTIYIKIKNKFIYAFLPLPHVLSIEETIRRITKDNLSICRFGDGEMELMHGLSLNFQKHEPELALRLRQAILSKKCLVCIPDIFSEKSFDSITENSKTFWLNHRNIYLSSYAMLLKGGTYGNAHISRFYIRYKDKTSRGSMVELLKTIWEGRDITFIEGEESRLGVGNDLFDNARRIQRILCPKTDAFNIYQQILNHAIKMPVSSLFILALGPTATCLAADLAERGFQALDLGHVDLEYEYFLRKSENVIYIAGKHCNEAAIVSSTPQISSRGNIKQEDEQKYRSQIVVNLCDVYNSEY